MCGCRGGGFTTFTTSTTFESGLKTFKHKQLLRDRGGRSMSHMKVAPSERDALPAGLERHQDDLVCVSAFTALCLMFKV